MTALRIGHTYVVSLRYIKDLSTPSFQLIDGFRVTIVIDIK